MAALGRGEEGRKEKTKSLPPPPNRTARRQWRNLTKEVKKNLTKTKSSLRREKRAFSATCSLVASSCDQLEHLRKTKKKSEDFTNMDNLLL